jgi:hypothetical protein
MGTVVQVLSPAVESLAMSKEQFCGAIGGRLATLRGSQCEEE